MTRKRTAQDEPQEPTHRYQKSTIALATMIEDKFLRLGTGTLNIKVDDIVVEYYRDGYADSLAEADDHVRKHIKTAWRYLWNEGQWHSVPATKFFFDTFVNSGRQQDGPGGFVLHRALWDEATTEIEIKRSVAGLGRAQRFIGLHFFIDDDDPLFVWHTAHHNKGGVGKELATLERVIDVAVSDKLTAGALTAIASRASTGTKSVHAHITTIRKIAASANDEGR